jgi:hypothetical protein
MTRTSLVLAGLAAATALAPPAHAGNFSFSFAGAGVNGFVQLTYAPNPNTGVIPGTLSPNLVDPVNSYIVTGISGVFSDANIGLSNAAITGIVPSKPANPEPTNYLAPHSFGFYIITNGVPVPGGLVAPGLSYDNLFYPGGAPATASDYTASGGVFDIYGLVFSIAGGNVVNFWSDGDYGGGATYGAAVTDGINLLDYADPGVLIPEPGSFWLLGASLLGVLASRRHPTGQAVAAIP